MQRAKRLLLAGCAALVAPWLPAAQRAGEPFPWGGDVERGSGEKLVDGVRAELRDLLRLAAEARAKKAADLAKRRGAAAIEAWKRYREPELAVLARACLDHPDWHVVHRALLWLERLRDEQGFARALALLDHREARLRERAALAALGLFEERDDFPATRHEAAERIAARLEREPELHVRGALRALQRRLAGGRTTRAVGGELVVRERDGLLRAPLLTGLDERDELAAYVERGGVVPFDEEAPAGGEAVAPLARQFVVPLLGYGVEEVPNLVLQAFGQGRRGGAIVHTGQDVGGCLDGAGLYAIGDGVVRSISGGHDAGVRFVVEHRLGEDEWVCAIYMHAAAVVHVEAGERVAPGQLLGTMGLSWSDENGGQFAHLHFGLYPGRYRPDHNYGYRRDTGDLSDWLDPKEWLATHAR